jgi:hypothetical protein
LHGPIPPRAGMPAYWYPPGSFEPFLFDSGDQLLWSQSARGSCLTHWHFAHRASIRMLDLKVPMSGTTKRVANLAYRHKSGRHRCLCWGFYLVTRECNRNSWFRRRPPGCRVDGAVRRVSSSPVSLIQLIGSWGNGPAENGSRFHTTRLRWLRRPVVHAAFRGQPSQIVEVLRSGLDSVFERRCAPMPLRVRRLGEAAPAMRF